MQTSAEMMAAQERLNLVDAAKVKHFKEFQGINGVALSRRFVGYGSFRLEIVATINGTSQKVHLTEGDDGGITDKTINAAVIDLAEWVRSVQGAS